MLEYIGKHVVLIYTYNGEYVCDRCKILSVSKFDKLDILNQKAIIRIGNTVRHVLLNDIHQILLA